MTDDLTEKTEQDLKEEIEARLGQLHDLGLHPEEIEEYVRGIADRMHDEIWQT